MSLSRSSDCGDPDEPLFFESLHKTPKRRRTPSVSSASQCSDSCLDLMERSIKSLQGRTHHCNFDNVDDSPDPFQRKTPKQRRTDSLRRRLTETQDRRRQFQEAAQARRALQEQEECPFTPTKVSTWNKPLPEMYDRHVHNCTHEETPVMINERSLEIIAEMGEKRGIWERQGPVIARRNLQPPSPVPQSETKHSRAATQRLFKSGIRKTDALPKVPENRGTPKPLKVIMETTDRLFQESLRPSPSAWEEEEDHVDEVVRRKYPNAWTLDQETRRFVKISERREREAEYRRQFREIQEIADCECADKDLVLYSQNGTIPRDLDTILYLRSMYKKPEETDNVRRKRREFVTKL